MKLITGGVCAALVWLYISQREFAAQSQMEQYRILCDAFTIPGVISIMLGFLLAIVLFASVRERVDKTDCPECFKGFPIALISAGLIALAFMGFPA